MSRTDWGSYLNKQFGRLTIIEILPNIPYKTKRCIAVCECGNVKEYYINNIVRGDTTSCRCLRKGFKIKHGMAIRGNTHLYNSYMKMIQRCYDTMMWNYKNYGGRGISVCYEWKNNPSSFSKWAHENGYMKGLQIDRINNDGNYEPSNCRWVTRKVNANNTRANVHLTYKGQTKTISEWAGIVGMEYRSFWSRVKRGWSIERIIEEPKRA